MEIKDIKISNIRNLELKSINFSRKNYITGANGSGKTSILESIVLSMTKKSFRTNKLDYILKKGKEIGLIKTRIKKKEIEFEFELTLRLKDKKKSLFINGKKPEDIYTLIRSYPVFFHSPYYEGITDKKNSKRLNFIDRILLLINKEYGMLMKKHNRLIIQKKRLLKDNNYKSISFYNEILSDIYDQIYNHRENLTELFNEKLSKVSKYKIKIDKKDKSELINKEKNFKKVFFSANSHRIYIIDDKNENVDDILSFGQKKEFSIYTVYFAVKTVEEYLKDDIIILLDDFEAGLDEKKIKSFYDNLSENQIIITGVENRFLNDINIIKL